MLHPRLVGSSAFTLSSGLACLFAHLPVHAALTGIPGMTDPQTASAGAIQAVCPSLVASNSLTPVQQDLRDICRAMVQTSNQILGTGPTAFSLNIGVDELRQGLQSVASEETAVQGANAVETGAHGTTRAIGARLFQLHQGATGFNLGGLNLNLNGVRLAGDQLVAPERGGAAGADAFGGKLGGFLNAGYTRGSKDQTSREDGFDTSSWGLVGGVDYRFKDNLVGGIALNYGQTDNDINTFPGGNIDNKTWGLSLYGTYYQSEAFYVDAHVNYTRNDFDTRRRIYILSNNPAIATIDRTAYGSTSGDQFTAGVSAGYNIQRKALTITPYGRLEYLDMDIDGYTENGAVGLDLQVDKQSVTSVQSAVGVQLAYAISTAYGVYVPQVHLEWNHEFDNDSRSITARYVNDPFNLSTFSVPTNNPDTDFFTLGAGVSTVLRDGMSLFVDVQTVLGYDKLDLWNVTAGARLAF